MGYVQSETLYVFYQSFVLSKFKDWDVELAGNGLNYPLQRVFNIGVNVSF